MKWEKWKAGKPKEEVNPVYLKSPKKKKGTSRWLGGKKEGANRGSKKFREIVKEGKKKEGERRMMRKKKKKEQYKKSKGEGKKRNAPGEKGT